MVAAHSPAASLMLPPPHLLSHFSSSSSSCRGAPLQGWTRGSEVDIQVRKLYCINRDDPKLLISMEDARRSAEGFAIAEAKGVPLVRVGQDTRLDYRVIDVRTLANQAIFRIQHQVENVKATPSAFVAFILDIPMLSLYCPKVTGEDI